MYSSGVKSLKTFKNLNLHFLLTTLRILIFAAIYFRELNEKRFEEPIIRKISPTFIFVNQKKRNRILKI